MAPANKGLEDKISSLIAQLALTNEEILQLTKLAEKHDTLLYGANENGGMISRVNTQKQSLEDHQNLLDKLEKSCGAVVAFMEAQLQINKQQADTNKNVNRVILALAGMTFLILLLIGVADISALHNILSAVKLPTP